MLLLIDIGNTHTVFAVCKSDGINAKWRMATNVNRTEDEYAVWLLQLMRHEKFSPEDITGVVISSVVPQTNFCILSFVEKYFAPPPLVVGEAGVKTGIDVVLPQPEEVGADRLVNALAAWKHCCSAAIVVDFGTATTFDVINDEGQYVGGIIAPGINLSLQALHVAAARLPNIAIAKPEKVVGTSTEAAMQSGIYYGYIGLIDGILDRLRDEYDFSPKVVATGGLASLFFGATRNIDMLESDLTLIGLKHVYELNNNRKD